MESWKTKTNNKWQQLSNFRHQTFDAKDVYPTLKKLQIGHFSRHIALWNFHNKYIFEIYTFSKLKTIGFKQDWRDLKRFDYKMAPYLKKNDTCCLFLFFNSPRNLYNFLSKSFQQPITTEHCLVPTFWPTAIAINKRLINTLQYFYFILFQKN